MGPGRRTWRPGLVALALLAVGCGSDDDPPATTATSATSTTSAPTADKAEFCELARQLRDDPPGSEASLREEGGFEAAVDEALVRLRRVRDVSPPEVREAAETFLAYVERLRGELAAVDYDITRVDPTPPPDAKAAEARLQEYAEVECGVLADE